MPNIHILFPPLEFPSAVIGDVLAVVLNPHWFCDFDLVVKVEKNRANIEKKCRDE